MVLGCDKLGIKVWHMKVVLGIEKSHQVTSSRVLTIGVSRDTSMGESYRTIEFPLFSTPMSCHRVKVMSTIFLWFFLLFLGR